MGSKNLGLFSPGGGGGRCDSRATRRPFLKKQDGPQVKQDASTGSHLVSLEPDEPPGADRGPTAETELWPVSTVTDGSDGAHYISRAEVCQPIQSASGCENWRCLWVTLPPPPPPTPIWENTINPGSILSGVATNTINRDAAIPFLSSRITIPGLCVSADTENKSVPSAFNRVRVHPVWWWLSLLCGLAQEILLGIHNPGFEDF